MLRPLNNHCLVEVIEEYGSVLRNKTDQQYQQGKLISFGITPEHLTVSTGYALENIDEVGDALTEMVGKTVYWQQYADSGQVFDIDGKKYALIPFYRLVGVEE